MIKFALLFFVAWFLIIFLWAFLYSRLGKEYKFLKVFGLSFLITGLSFTSYFLISFMLIDSFGN